MEAFGGVLAAGALAVAALVAAAAAVAWWRWRWRVRQLQEELEEARDRAAGAVAAREAFFDLVTHELRSPLAAILGYQELLQDGAYGELDSADEPIQRIGRSARHLLHLIEGLIELTQLRSGGLSPTLAPVDLDALMAAVGDAFRDHARDRGLEGRVHIPPALPTIRSDEDRLARALDLLVTSAIKHPGSGGMSLHVEALEDGATLTIDGADIAVRDEFDDPAGRLGIRLAVVARVVTLLNGELRLEPRGGASIHRLVLTLRDAGGEPRHGDRQVPGRPHPSPPGAAPARQTGL